MRILFVYLYTLALLAGCSKDEVSKDEVSNSEKQITKFEINSIVGDIDEQAKTIKLVLPYNTNLTNLAPILLTTGSSVSPASGEIVDCSNNVTYTVTASDGTTVNYTLIVTKEIRSLSKIEIDDAEILFINNGILTKITTEGQIKAVDFIYSNGDRNNSDNTISTIVMIDEKWIGLEAHLDEGYPSILVSKTTNDAYLHFHQPGNLLNNNHELVNVKNLIYRTSSNTFYLEFGGGIQKAEAKEDNKLVLTNIDIPTLGGTFLTSKDNLMLSFKRRIYPDYSEGDFLFKLPSGKGLRLLDVFDFSKLDGIVENSYLYSLCPFIGIDGYAYMLANMREKTSAFDPEQSLFLIKIMVDNNNLKFEIIDKMYFKELLLQFLLSKSFYNQTNNSIYVCPSSGGNYRPYIEIIDNKIHVLRNQSLSLDIILKNYAFDKYKSTDSRYYGVKLADYSGFEYNIPKKYQKVRYIPSNGSDNVLSFYVQDLETGVNGVFFHHLDTNIDRFIPITNDLYTAINVR